VPGSGLRPLGEGGAATGSRSGSVELSSGATGGGGMYAPMQRVRGVAYLCGWPVDGGGAGAGAHTHRQTYVACGVVGANTSHTLTLSLFYTPLQTSGAAPGASGVGVGATPMSQMEADEALARQLQRAEMDGISTPLILGGGAGSQGQGLGAGGRDGPMDEARQTRLNALQKCVVFFDGCMDGWIESLDGWIRWID
jgi:hypothetical protein